MRKSFIKLLVFTVILIAVALPLIFPITSTDISAYIPSIHAKLEFIEQENVYLYQISKFASIGFLYLIVAVQFVIVLPLMLIGTSIPYFMTFIGLAIVLMLNVRLFVRSNRLFSKGLLSKFIGLALIIEVFAISIIIPITYDKISEMINLFIS